MNLCPSKVKREDPQFPGSHLSSLHDYYRSPADGENGSGEFGALSRGTYSINGYVRMRMEGFSGLAF